MKTSLWLRAAAVLTLLYAIGHTSGMPWTPSLGEREAAAVAAMKSAPFDVMGSSRTYWDFYVGFGAILGAYLAVQAVVLWLLGGVADTLAQRLRPFIAAFLVSFAVNAVLAWQFFFPIAVAFTSAITICLAVALACARPRNPA
jgi:hypothetical protein